ATWALTAIPQNRLRDATIAYGVMTVVWVLYELYWLAVLLLPATIAAPAARRLHNRNGSSNSKSGSGNSHDRWVDSLAILRWTDSLHNKTVNSPGVMSALKSRKFCVGGYDHGADGDYAGEQERASGLVAEHDADAAADVRLALLREGEKTGASLA
ncbi:hypothetical protein OC834_007915, partial [Tilletia horrida]